MAYNLVTNTVAAIVDASVITAASLEVSADSSPLLVNIAAGGAGANTLAIGGSIAVNSIADAVDAHVAGSTVTTTGDVAVTAGESAALYAFGGGGAHATSGNAVGAAFAYNYVGGSFDAADPSVIDYDDGRHGTTTPTVEDADSDIDSSVTAYVTTPSILAGGALSVLAGYERPAVEEQCPGPSTPPA